MLPELAYSVDKQSWPIVTIAATPSVADDGALEATYAALTLVLARRQHFGIVVDVRGAVSNPKRRKRLSAWAEEYRHAVDYFVVGVGAVADSAMERGVVTAALWLLRTPAKVRVFPDHAGAEAWLRELLAAR